MGDKSFEDYSLSLRLRGEKIDIDTITKIMGIEPSMVYVFDGKQGEELDLWCYSDELDTKEDFADSLSQFCTKIKNVDELLEEAPHSTGELVLHIHVEMAQFFFELPSVATIRLLEMGLPFGISIFSWGMVEGD
ncbi:MAG: hypothetical protein FWD93_05965 [Coriobacteriia bacterium]|nr:hypothetical protein [Coriobacteriia bacterium]